MPIVVGQGPNVVSKNLNGSYRVLAPNCTSVNKESLRGGKQFGAVA
jgi:hypothetical protein